jgi:hypothetical protein
MSVTSIIGKLDSLPPLLAYPDLAETFDAIVVVPLTKSSLISGFPIALTGQGFGVGETIGVGEGVTVGVMLGITVFVGLAVGEGFGVNVCPVVDEFELFESTPVFSLQF